MNVLTEFSKAKQTSGLLPGPAGQLEAILTYPKGGVSDSVAIICHPHPLHEGTMHNKVVYTVARLFDELGMPTVRFNFRGVGASHGTYGDAVGEVEDLRAVLAWLQAALPDKKVWLAGFSFGSYIAAKVATTLSQPPAGLLLVAPAVEHFSFHSLPSLPERTVVVQCDDDEVVPAHLVHEWINGRSESIHCIRYEEGGHFFHGKLVTLREDVLTQLRNEA